MNWRRAIAVLFALCSALAAHGQVLSYLVSIPSASTSWNKTVELPSFDASLGTLTGVQLFLTGNTVQTLRAENLDAAHAASYNLETMVTFSAGLSGGPALVTTGPASVYANGILCVYDGVMDYSGASGFSLTQNRSVSANSADANLANYIGTGPIDFFASASLTRSSWTMTGSAANILGSPTTAGAFLEVRYAYASPIPEPGATAALLALFAFGGVAVRRFRAMRHISSGLNHA